MHLIHAFTLVSNALVCLGGHIHGATSDDVNKTIFGTNGTITLLGTSPTSGTLVLDYGSNVEGFPTFDVISANGDTSALEITYSESLSILNSSPTVRAAFY